MMKKYINILGLLLLTLLLMSCSADAQSEIIEFKVPIRLGESVIDDVENHYITIGELVPKSQVDVVSSIQGIVDTIFVKPGDYVEADSPIIAVENDLVESNLDTTESQLRTIRNNLAISYNSALSNYNKQKLLFDANAISKNQLDTSYDQLITIQYQYEDARNNYNNQVSNLKDSVDDLIIKSPIKGQVASIYVNEGQGSSNQIVATIIETETLNVKTFISSDLKKSINREESVDLITESGQSIKGSIETINELPDPQTRLYEVIIKVEAINDFIVGDFVEIIFTTEKYQAILIPSRAIVRKGNEQYIWIYKNNALKKKNVVTGLSKDEWVEISNLQENITLVISGQNNLSENDLFMIAE